MKKIILPITLIATFSVNALAQKHFTRGAHVSFFSDTPVEKIEAHNHQATTIVDLEKNEMVFSILMKSFEFEKALMQEHFNEKYVHSDKFPKAQFKGTFEPSNPIDLSNDGEYPVTVSGTMTLHGVDKKVSTDGVFTVAEGKLTGTSEFSLLPEDYDINIPGVVREKIAKEVKITVRAEYEPYKK